VLAARGELGAARERLERAKGLWPDGAALLDAEAKDRLPLDPVRREAPAVLQAHPPRSPLESALFEDDPAVLRRLAAAHHTPAGLAQAPALVLLTELRLAVREPAPGRLHCLVRAAAALGDAPRLSRAAGLSQGEDRPCSSAAGGARDEAPDAGGYPEGNSTGAPLHGVPEAVAPAWAAHRAGRPREARLLVDRAYLESGRSEDVLVWVRLIQGVPGEAALWGGT
jgi:hypothetical protein